MDGSEQGNAKIPFTVQAAGGAEVVFTEDLDCDLIVRTEDVAGRRTYGSGSRRGTGSG
jgi:hypothetical protein